MLFIRSLLFALALLIITPVWAVVCLIAMFLPYNQRFYVASRWNVTTIWLAKVLCGIRYEIKGHEKLPKGSAILLAKHQSAWETIFLAPHMPRPLVFILKKELLYIPFFGWVLGLMRMIPIDRQQSTRALRKIMQEGKKRLKEGLWIILFPEGTRVPVGEKGIYKGSGTRLAIETGAKIVPIAHNSGECWPRNGFIKKPGLITVSIGDAISPEGKTADELMRQVENWIETEMRNISPHIYKDA